MAMTIRIDIVSAESEIFSGAATMVFAPAEMGEVGIAPRHSPLLTRLKPGEVRVQTSGGEEHYFYIWYKEGYFPTNQFPHDLLVATS